ncbi:hypothetical protein L1987_12989 [Smallanthus sonchifolius]|uniref:Uncharacterized protein n=1 Tax=Smallanthus sonchifolius TaxID=185202 RepID=A0ACB9JFR2_9ASTR|nr:hypothetical protein L1987_12989 [Smallanthus sonchifolius]
MSKEEMTKKERGKRGAASCAKKYEENDNIIEFDDLMRPIGPTTGRFSSWLGQTVRTDLPYQLDTKCIEKHQWEKVCATMATTWHITDDSPKKNIIKRAKRLFSNWRSTLITEFVNVGTRPFDKYPYLEEEHWEAFVAEKTNPEFLAKSEKARASALANQNFGRVGRKGYAGFEPKVETI